MTASLKKPSPEQLAALDLYATANGRYWKQKLRKAWWEGTDLDEDGGCYLRQIRNQFGSRWLAGYKRQ